MSGKIYTRILERENDALHLRIDMKYAQLAKARADKPSKDLVVTGKIMLVGIVTAACAVVLLLAVIS